MQKLFKSFPDPSFFYYTQNQEDGSDDPFLKENGIKIDESKDWDIQGSKGVIEFDYDDDCNVSKYKLLYKKNNSINFRLTILSS